MKLLFTSQKFNRFRGKFRPCPTTLWHMELINTLCCFNSCLGLTYSTNIVLTLSDVAVVGTSSCQLLVRRHQRRFTPSSSLFHNKDMGNLESIVAHSGSFLRVGCGHYYLRCGTVSLTINYLHFLMADCSYHRSRLPFGQPSTSFKIFPECLTADAIGRPPYL